MDASASTRSQQFQEALALTNAAEHRGTAVGVALNQALISNAEEPWVREAAELENARFYFSTGHFNHAVDAASRLIAESGEPTSLRGKAYRLLAAATMAKPDLSDQQLAEVEEWLDESQRIFEIQRDAYQLGQVLRERGKLAVWRNEMQDGSDLIAVGQKLEHSFARPSAGTGHPAAVPISAMRPHSSN